MTKCKSSVLPMTNVLVHAREQCHLYTFRRSEEVNFYLFILFFILIFGADLTHFEADLTGNRIEYVALQISLLQIYNTTEKTDYVCYVACVLLSTNNNTYRTDPCCIMLLIIILLSNVMEFFTLLQNLRFP
jgi:hypothetical protein